MPHNLRRAAGPVTLQYNSGFLVGYELNEKVLMMLRSTYFLACWITVSLAYAGPYSWLVENQLTQGKELRLQLEGVAALKTINVTIQSATGQPMWSNSFNLLGQDTAIFPLWMPPTETPDGTYTCTVQGGGYQQMLSFLLYGHLQENSIPKIQEFDRLLTNLETQLEDASWPEAFSRPYRDLAGWVRDEMLLKIESPTGSQPFDQFLGLIDRGLRIFSEMGIRRRAVGYKTERPIVQRLSLEGTDYYFTRPWSARYTSPNEQDIASLIQSGTEAEGWIPIEFPCNLYQQLPFSWHISDPNDYQAHRVLDWIQERAWWFRTTVALSKSHILARTGGELVVEGAQGSIQTWIDGQPVSESNPGVYPIPDNALDDEQVTFVFRLVPKGAGASDKKSGILRRLTTPRMPPDKETRPDPTLHPQLEPLGIMGNLYIRPSKAVHLLSYSIQPILPEKEKQPQLKITMELDNQLGREGTFEIRLSGSTTPRISLVLEERKIPQGRSTQTYFLPLEHTFDWLPGLDSDKSEFVPGNFRGTESRDLVMRERFLFTFRTVALGTDPLGRSAVLVNGKPFTVRGAKWMGIDASGYWEDPEALVNRLNRLLDMAMHAQFNTLWVIRDAFEPDEFYSGCDERGLMVWQRINPPESAWTDLPAWIDQLKKKIQGHPCLAGLETSPALPDERRTQLAEALKQAQIPLLIDTLPWKEFEVKTPALPHQDTIRSYLGVFGSWPPNAAVWQYHGADPAWLKSVAVCADLPNAVTETQEIQAREFQNIMDTASAAGPIMDGLMFGRFNDPWPCISTSMVDYYGRPKRLYYEVKRWNVPQRMVIRGDDPKQIWIENRTDRELNGMLSIIIGRTDADLAARRSDVSTQESVRVTVPPWQDQVVYSIETKQIENFDPAANFVCGRLSDEGRDVLRGIGFWTTREGLIPPQNAFLRISKGPALAPIPFIRIRSRGFIDTFWIDDSDLRIILDDNYFDIADTVATVNYHLAPDTKEIPSIEYGAKRLPSLEISISSGKP